jgi:hypothetical protein
MRTGLDLRFQMVAGVGITGPARHMSSVSQLYPNRVSTFRVICSICGSRPASP